MQILLARIEKVEQLAEQAAKGKTKFSPDCICFPDDEQPFFGFPVEEAIASKLKCPLHGERIRMRFPHLYLAPWRREREKVRRSSLSPQYQKAWNASFPPHLWPAEEVPVDGQLVLRLKDGSLIATGSTVIREE